MTRHRAGKPTPSDASRYDQDRSADRTFSRFPAIRGFRHPTPPTLHQPPRTFSAPPSQTEGPAPMADDASSTPANSPHDRYQSPLAGRYAS
ncbi:MAG: hypothetical protein ACNA8P_04965, partial [Phycisphaerales bacterium]